MTTDPDEIRARIDAVLAELPDPADVENAPADLIGFRNRRAAALVEHLAEHEIVDRRPAPISLFDPLAVDVPSHSLCPDFSQIMM